MSPLCLVYLAYKQQFQYLPKKILNQLLPSPKATTIQEPQEGAEPRQAKKDPVPKQKAPTTTTNPTTVISAQAVAIMAEEIGITRSEMTDDCELAALGVDSLLGLTISGKFREVFEMDVPSTLFTDYQTVGEVKQFVTQYLSLDDTPWASGGMNTPFTSNDSCSDTSASSAPSDAGDVKVAAGTVALMKDIISEETGISSHEMTPETSLADSGIDSLMLLQILGSLREQCGMDLPATFFVDHDTFGDIEKTLGFDADMDKDQDLWESAADSQPAKQVAPSDGVPSKPKMFSRENLDANAPSATSILVQGNPKIATKSLFLFPDGSGSATSYASIPKVDDDVCVYGLNCPYMKQPESYTCGIDGAVTLYLREIRRRQLRGPYYLGGWSAGGECAYEACLQLQEVGETVERLILFDAPCPLGLASLPSRLHHFFGSIGLLGTGGNVPAWLLPHFEYSIKNLAAYNPTPMDPRTGTPPKTYSIMAQDGVCKNPEDPRPEPQPDDPPNMNWLLYNRTDFGYNGWDQLLGAENITHTESVPNVNHFTMMRETGAKSLGGHIKKALVDK